MTKFVDMFNAKYIFSTDLSSSSVVIDCESDRACVKSTFAVGLELDYVISKIESNLPPNATNIDLSMKSIMS